MQTAGLSAPFFVLRPQLAGPRPLEAIEDPGDPERHDHERMESAPSQPVEPRRNIGRDDRPTWWRGCLSGECGFRCRHGALGASTIRRAPVRATIDGGSRSQMKKRELGRGRARAYARTRSKNYAYQNWKAHRSGALRPGYLDNPA